MKKNITQIKGDKLTKIIKNRTLKNKTKKQRICSTLIKDGFDESFCSIINDLTDTDIESIFNILEYLIRSGDKNPDFYIYEMCLYNRHVPSNLIRYELELYDAIRYEKGFIKTDVLLNKSVLETLASDQKEYDAMKKEQVNVLKNKYKNIPTSRIESIVDKAFEIVDLELIPNNNILENKNKMLIDKSYKQLYDKALLKYIREILNIFSYEELNRINEKFIDLGDIIISIFPNIKIYKGFWNAINSNISLDTRESLIKSIKLACDTDENIKSFLEKDDLIYNDKKMSDYINKFKYKKEGVINKMKNKNVNKKIEKVIDFIHSKCLEKIILEFIDSNKANIIINKIINSKNINQFIKKYSQEILDIVDEDFYIASNIQFNNYKWIDEFMISIKECIDIEKIEKINELNLNKFSSIIDIINHEIENLTFDNKEFINIIKSLLETNDCEAITNNTESVDKNKIQYHKSIVPVTNDNKSIDINTTVKNNTNKNLSIIYSKIKNEIFDEINLSDQNTKDIYEFLLYYYNKSSKNKNLLIDIINKLKSEFSINNITNRFILLNNIVSNSDSIGNEHFNINKFKLLLESF